MNLQPGQVIAHRFRLVRELGRGGVGAVWLAHQLALDVPCALKFFVGAETDLEQYRRRFELEAKAAAKLQHPNVVRVFDTGIWQSRPFIAMELLEGEGLDARLRRRGRLLPSETIAFCAQVASALTKAHAFGIVHRDLKPSNIFLAREHDRIVVKVIDFGIAKTSTFSAAPSALTHTETILGTPAYMSPEQIEGTHPLDGRSDLWSLAVIVFECLTGHLPFDSTTVGDVFARITYKPIPMPSQVIGGLPPAFDAWWSRASARDMGARFQTAAELCDALARSLGVNSGTLPDGTRASVIPPYEPGDAAWFQISHSALPAPLISAQPTLSGQARPPSLRPVRSRGRRFTAIALISGVFLLAGIAAVVWSTRASPVAERSSPHIALGALSAAPAPSAAPSAAAPPPVTAEPSPAAPPLEPAESPAATAAARGSSAPEPAAAAPASSSKVKTRPGVKPRRSSEWGF